MSFVPRTALPMFRAVLLMHVTFAADTFECEPGSCFAQTEDPFLGRVVSTRPRVRSEVEMTLQSSFRADTEDRLQLLMSELRPTYVALPKTEYGLLGDEAVRHLLHRHFVRTRAWIVRGLAPDGGPWNRSGTLELLRESAPPSVATLFEQRLGGRGLELREVALLAAMLENQVHQDTIERLRLAWLATVGPNRSTTSLSVARNVLDAYMMSYVYTNGFQYLKKDVVDRAVAMVGGIFPEWGKTQAFVRTTLRHTIVGGAKEVTFVDLERTVVEITEHYGSFQAEDCSSLKSMLLESEGKQPGRIPVGAFYKKTVEDGAYQFTESVEYMRHAGVLEEIAGRQNVIIANYLDCPSQLVASSKNYAVACQDECEPILAKLEEQLAAPEAPPFVLASLVAAISTGTQPARRSGLPDALRQKLDAIAAVDNNTVPLHGRLFAQFLHHAFPRECPYPHGAGFTVDPMLPEDYEVFTGRHGSSSETHASMRRLYEEYKELKVKEAALSPEEARRLAEHAAELPWDPTEELLAPRVKLRGPPSTLGATLQAATGFTAMALLLPNIAMFEWLVTTAYTFFPGRKGAGYYDPAVTVI